MKVLVCGGLDYADTKNVWTVLDSIHVLTPITHVIHSGESGAAASGAGWAFMNGVQPVECEANWNIFQTSASTVRNAAELSLNPDLVVAFPDPNGTETADMITQATTKGVPVRVIP